MIKASAPGKIILFGEHAVVYGEAAIATAINRRANVTVCTLDEKKIVISFKHEGDDHDIEAALGSSVANPFIKTVQFCLDHFGIKKGIGVEVDSKVPIQAGLGSSAAICTSIAAAVVKQFTESEDIETDLINQAAFEGEKIAHGSPSGLDNCVSSYGGTLHFKRGVIEPIEFAPFDLIVASTGIHAPTKELVSRVKSLIEDPRMATHLFKISSIVWSAKEALRRRNLFEIGKLMDRNHECLRSLGVSTQELENLVSAAKKAGALGAKLTGAGGGGCMIALAEEAHIDHIIGALKEAGAKSVFRVKISQQGAKIE